MAAAVNAAASLPRERRGFRRNSAESLLCCSPRDLRHSHSPAAPSFPGRTWGPLGGCSCSPLRGCCSCLLCQMRKGYTPCACCRLFLSGPRVPRTLELQGFQPGASPLVLFAF